MHNHLVCKRTLNHLAKLAWWLSCVVLFAFICTILSCHLRVLEWTHNHLVYKRTLNWLNGSWSAPLMKMIMIMMKIFFVVWLTNKRHLALFSARTIVRDPHHHKSPTRREQDLNNAQNRSLGFVEWSCAVVITTTSRRHNGMNFYEQLRTNWLSARVLFQWLKRQILRLLQADIYSTFRQI